MLFSCWFVFSYSTGTSLSQDNTTAPKTTDIWTQKWLLGDWGGERTKLEEEKGVSFDFHYFGDFLCAENARIQSGCGAWNRVRGTMDVDFGKLAGWKGLTMHVTGLWQGGPNIGGNYLGSISNPSTLVSVRATMLDSWWFAYGMLDGKATVRFGQFASMDYYGLPPWIWHYMMEPLSYGFNNRGNDYASWDPASGPGIQLLVNPKPWMYYSLAYTSGNRNPYQQNPTGFEYVKHDSGVLSDNVGFNINQPGTGKTAKEKYYTGRYESDRPTTAASSPTPSATIWPQFLAARRRVRRTTRTRCTSLRIPATTLSISTATRRSTVRKLARTPGWTSWAVRVFRRMHPTTL